MDASKIKIMYTGSQGVQTNRPDSVTLKWASVHILFQLKSHYFDIEEFSKTIFNP